MDDLGTWVFPPLSGDWFLAEPSTTVEELREDLTYTTTTDGDLYDSADDDSLANEQHAVDPEDALLVTAQRKDGTYALLLDLDVPAYFVPSKTEGHGHLYVDVHMTKEQHDLVMLALNQAGIEQTGHARGAVMSPFGGTLRPPWVIKGEDKTRRQQAEEK